MKKYFLIQGKRLLRTLPSVLLAAAILFGCVALAYCTLANMNDDAAQQTKFRVGIVGAEDNSYLQMGMLLLETLDSSRFSLNFISMEEDAARSAIRRGEISAFLVFPEGFMDAAFYGEIMPITFYSGVGADGLVSLVKEELSNMVESMLLHSQKGIYGAGDAAHAYGGNANVVIEQISLQYADVILSRSHVYNASQIGLHDGLGANGYLLTGLGIVLFMMICLSFAPMMIRRDPAMARMLKSRAKPVSLQVLCDFGVYLAGLLAIVLVVLGLLLFFPGVKLSLAMILQTLPVVFCLGAMSFLLYEVTSNLVSGVLMQFFITLALCFVSGCLYPITFFPDSVQMLSRFLPTGIAREQLGNCLLNRVSLPAIAALLALGCLFLVSAVCVRKYKVSGVRG